MSKGFTISMPLVDSSVYDCILDNGCKLLKIQIKAIYQKAKVKGSDKWKLNLRHSGQFYNKKDVHFFAVYVSELDGFFIIPNNQQKALVINIRGKYRNNFNNFALFY
tara:strand:- start:1939 stop:2259 length:321 start_codon:yes stop_codon:yes gene_type:complete